MPALDRIRVVIAVLTFRRPRDLAEVIPELIEQAATVEADVTILVVDNDPEGGAAAQVQAFAVGHPVRYVHEPVPGIAPARRPRSTESPACRRWTPSTRPGSRE